MTFDFRSNNRIVNENLIVELVKNKVISDTFRRLNADKKNRLYQIAVKLFGEYGYDGLSVDQYCEEASISKGSFFQYFPSKSHLLEFAILIFDDYLEQLFGEIRKAEPGPMVRQKISHLYDALVINSRIYSNEEKFYLFATRAIDHSAVSLQGIDLERHLVVYVEEIVRRGEETGEIRGDFNIDLTSNLVSLIIGALVNNTYGRKKETLRETESYLITFLFDGISAR
jgi:AcrR family transcriptional regulator